MAGTKEGGLKVKAKLLAKDPEYYSKLGAKGGKVGGENKGFGNMAKTNPEMHKVYSAKGGHISRKKKQ